MQWPLSLAWTQPEISGYPGRESKVLPSAYQTPWQGVWSLPVFSTVTGMSQDAPGLLAFLPDPPTCHWCHDSLLQEGLSRPYCPFLPSSPCDNLLSDSISPAHGSERAGLCWLIYCLVPRPSMGSVSECSVTIQQTPRTFPSGLEPPSHIPGKRHTAGNTHPVTSSSV
jgi:hypothetical protein